MFRERIKSVYSELSPSFQRLGDYLLDHAYEAAFVTATQLGKQLDVDTATVVRFAQKLGYPGYPELLSEVQSEVREQLSRHFAPARMGEDATAVFRASIRQNVTNLEQFGLNVDDQTVARIVSLIDRASRIWIVGEGVGAGMTDLLVHMLHTLMVNVQRLIPSAGTVSAEFRTLNANDLIIAVAITPYCPDVTSVVQVAHALGAQTVVLAGGLSWPVALAADVAVLCPNNAPARLSVSCASFTAAIDAIVQALFYSRHEEYLNRYVDFTDILGRLNEARGQFSIEPPTLTPPSATGP